MEKGGSLTGLIECNFFMIHHAIMVLDAAQEESRSKGLKTSHLF